ncbi:MAG: hypothetical protein JNN08_08185 [Bryobacterales bacterium]|nr:hypothetical protein [Bryobacterales bacterium]
MRNLVLSGLAERLAESAEVVFGTPEDRPLTEQLAGWETLTLPTVSQSSNAYESRRRRLGRAHFWVTSTMVADSLTKLYQHRASWKKRLYILANYGLRGRLEARPHWYSRLVRLERELWWKLNELSEETAHRLLSGFDAVVFPMPHSPREWWTARWAQRFGLKTIAMIHSFDNPTTTFRHPIHYDEYLVWNTRMAGELTRIYPEIDPSSIHVTGTPHFYFHYCPSFAGSRSELAAMYNLNPRRPILLYAGGPISLVPHEATLVRRLYDDLLNWPIDARPQIIVRPHPIEPHFQHWEELRASCADVRWSIPWQPAHRDREWVIPSAANMREFCMLVRNADLVVNCCSTMSIDAAICDTPVICLDYVLPPFEDFASHVHRYYQWDHYKPLIATGGIRLAASPEELLSFVRQYLADPSLDREHRAHLVSQTCGPCPDDPIPAIASTITRLIGAEHRVSQPTH